MRNILLTSIALIAFAFLGNAQNCPTYSPTVTATGEACGGQGYTMSFENDGCNTQIYFNYSGSLGTTAGSSVQIVSTTTNNIIYSQAGNGTYTGAIGPIDPAVEGIAFNLIVVDGTFTITQGGLLVAQAVDENTFFNTDLTISTATLVITTPSGNITRSVDYCKDFNVQIPLANTNFCSTIAVGLPWTITCDYTGAVIQSGVHAVTVYPQVPSDPRDLVDITWDATTCSWDVSANFDCSNTDIGTIFTVVPDPLNPTNSFCADGDQTFTITYLGIPGGPNCCPTAGAPDPIIYNASSNSSNTTVANSPFGGTNNAAYISLPPNNSGGNANSINLSVAVNNYCSFPLNYEYLMNVYVDGIAVSNYPFVVPNVTIGYNLASIPWYDQDSEVEVYIFPSILSNGGNNTTFVPNGVCGSLNPMEWRANISASINVEFVDSLGSQVDCFSDTLIAFTDCTPIKPVLIEETAADCNAPSTLLITNYDNTLTYTFSPVGPSISSTGIVSGAAGNYTITVDNGNCTNQEAFVIDSGKPVPSFTLNSTNPTVCAGSDGTITISGLDNNITYGISYDNNSTTVGPTSLTSSASGEIIITGLNAGGYSNFTVDLNGCDITDNSVISLTDPNAPTVDAGIDQTVCDGSLVTLTALNYPAGATITWDNGVTDGTPFTPTVTQTYIVTVMLNGCSSTDNVTVTLTPKAIPTFNAISNFCENTIAPSLPATSIENIPGTWNPAVVSNAQGAATYTFTPDAGLCVATETMVITVDPEPTPTITAPSDICVNAGVITLIGTPIGGTFSGVGMTGADFDPFAAGLGTHAITYTYTDGNSCTGSSIENIVVNTNLEFTITSANPTVCGGIDGTITIEGLDNNVVYIVSYDDNGANVGPNNLTSNGTGEIVITGLNAGTYTNFYVESNGCFRTDNSNVNLSDPNAPSVNAGVDQTICEGTPVTLTASGYPVAANISWDQGVTDGVSFTPTATQTYTVTAELNNCTSNESVIITVQTKTVPTFSGVTDFCENIAAPILPAISDEGVNGTWNPAVIVNNIGTANYVFTPDGGECAIVQDIDVTVHPEPTLSIDPVADLCEYAAAVTLVGSPLGGVFSGTGITIDSFDPNTAGVGTHTITYDYTDGNGCSSSTTTDITVNINILFTLNHTNPTVCSGTNGTIIIGGLDVNENYQVSYFNGSTVGPAIMTSNSSGNIVIAGLSAGAYSDFDVIFNSCQGINNSSIVLSDPPGPTISAGLDQELCPGETLVLTAFNPDGASVSWNNGVTDGVGFVPPIGTTTYTLTAGLLNCISYDHVIITVPPSITGITCPSGLTASCAITQQPAYANLASFLADGGAISIPAGGKVDSTSFTLLSEVSDGNSCSELVTRTYQLTDVCGVSVTCTQTITINDLTAPTGTAPADITVQCAADLPAVDVTSITDAADNCTASPIVTHVSDVSSGSSCLEVITRTYNIADDCGNNIDVVQTITIQDDTAPTGTVPNDTTVVCIWDVPLADISLVTNVADNCTATPTVTHTGDVSDGNTCPEVITRTYNIVDDCGNSTNLIQTITINDDVLPTASNPDSLTVACLADVPVVDIAVVTDAADNCTAAPTVAFVSETSNGSICNGEEITRIYSVTDDCGNSIDVTQIITINLSAPSFTVSGTDPTTCLGSDGTITLSGLDASTNYDISYNGGATISVTSDASGEYTITGLSAGTYVDYTVTETACSACSTTENVSITLTDPNPPTVDAGLDLQVCEGESISLNAVNPDAANLTWNNGVVDGVGFIPPVGTTTYNVIAELANCFTEDSLEVVVNPLPVVSAGSFLEVCEGEQVTLSGSGANTYVWDNGVTDGVPFTPPVGTTTYTVTGESVFGCEDTDQVQVRVLPAPIVSFTANTREGCAPEEINLISTTTGVSNQCRFTIEGGTVLTGCNVTNIFTTAGCYDVNLEVEAANGCSSDITIVDYICIDNYPVADFSVYPEELSTFNNSGEFTNESSGAVTYDWDFGDSTYSNAINPNHVYSVSENSPEVTYEVKLIAYSPLGCADSTVLSLPYFEDLIYNVPNTFTPDGNLFNETFKPVFTSGFDPMEYKLKIYNRWGELIFESNDPAYGWDGTYGASNIIFAPEGTYLWKISFKKLKDDENVEVVGSVNLLR